MTTQFFGLKKIPTTIVTKLWPIFVTLRKKISPNQVIVTSLSLFRNVLQMTKKLWLDGCHWNHREGLFLVDDWNHQMTVICEPLCDKLKKSLNIVSHLWDYDTCDHLWLTVVLRNNIFPMCVWGGGGKGWTLVSQRLTLNMTCRNQITRSKV